MDVEKMIDQLQLACGACDGVYFAFRPGKAEKKVQLATKAFSAIPDGETVLYCYDDTLFGAADNGFVTTVKGIYIQNFTEDPAFVAYPDCERFFVTAKDRIGIRTPSNPHVMISVAGGGQEKRDALLKLLQMTKELVLQEQPKRKRTGAVGTVRKKQGKAKPKEAAACASCGAPLPAHAKFCTSCGVLAASEAPLKCCQQCGAMLPAGANFCTECGAKV